MQCLLHKNCFGQQKSNLVWFWRNPLFFHSSWLLLFSRSLSQVNAEVLPQYWQATKVNQPLILIFQKRKLRLWLALCHTGHLHWVKCGTHLVDLYILLIVPHLYPLYLERGKRQDKRMEWSLQFSQYAISIIIILTICFAWNRKNNLILRNETVILHNREGLQKRDPISGYRSGYQFYQVSSASVKLTICGHYSLGN